jgi:hypothetical protein
MPNETQLVQMRLLPKTMDRLSNLQKLTKTDNRTQIISTAIQLAELVIDSIEKGGNVYIQSPDGKIELVRIVGI